MLEINVLIPLAFVVGMIGLALAMKFGWLWFLAHKNGVNVEIPTLVGMSLRKTPAHLIVTNLIAAKQAGLDLNVRDLEGLHLAGGHVTNVVRALIVSAKAQIPLDFKRACAIDLSGKDLNGLVASVANPKVLQCQDPFTKGDIIEAQASDGTPIWLKADITVRPCLARVIGGGDEKKTVELATKRLIALIAKYSGEEVLRQPSVMGDELVAQDKESGAAFEIISVNIMARKG